MLLLIILLSIIEVYMIFKVSYKLTECYRIGDIKNIYKVVLIIGTTGINISIVLNNGTITAIKYIVLVSILILIAVIDFFTTDVYLINTAVGVVLSILFILINLLLKQDITSYLKGGAVAFIITMILHFIGGLGSGDIEVATMIGLFIGFKYTMATIILSFLIGGIFAITKILLKKSSFKDKTAFCPFLTISTIITIISINTLDIFITYWYMY